MAKEFYTKHLNAAGTRLTAFLYGLSSTGSVADVAQKLAELPAAPIDLPVLRGWLARYIIVSIGGADRDPGPDFRVVVPGVEDAPQLTPPVLAEHARETLVRSTSVFLATRGRKARETSSETRVVPPRRHRKQTTT